MIGKHAPKLLGLLVIAAALSMAGCPVSFAVSCETDQDCGKTQTCIAGGCRTTGFVPALDGGYRDGGQLDDAGADAGDTFDSGLGDSGLGDAGPGDAGPGDAGPGDAGPGDAGPGDAGPGDAGSDDAGPIDAGYSDPVATDDSYVVTDGNTLAPTTSVLYNDDPGSASQLIAVLVQGPNAGTFSLQPDGMITFEVAATTDAVFMASYKACDANDLDACSDTANISLTASPLAPIVAPDSIEFDEDTPAPSLNVLTNDSSPASAVLSAEAVGELPSEVDLQPNGDVVLTLAPNQNGVITFQYVAVDTALRQSLAVDVTINITPVNDAPTIEEIILLPSTITGPGSILITASASDVDDDTLTYDFALAALSGASIQPNTPQENQATLTLDGTTPEGQYDIVLNVSDGTVTETLDGRFTISSSALVIDIAPVAPRLFPGESITLDATASSSTGGNLRYIWSTPNPPDGVTINDLSNGLLQVSVDRDTFYAAVLPPGDVAFDVNLTLGDASEQTVSDVIQVIISDERGGHVDGRNGLTNPCGHRLRPCALVSDAFSNLAAVRAAGGGEGPDVMVLALAPVQEVSRIVMNNGLNLRCGYDRDAGGNWARSNKMTLIEIDDFVGVQHLDLGKTEISNCRIHVVTTDQVNLRYGVSVAHAISIIDSEVVGSTSPTSLTSVGVLLDTSPVSSTITNSTVTGTTENSGATFALRAKASATIDGSFFFGGVSTSTSAGVDGSGSSTVLTIGTTTMMGGRSSDASAIGLRFRLGAVGSVTSSTMQGANDATLVSNNSTAVRMLDLVGTVSIGSSLILLRGGEVSSADTGVLADQLGTSVVSLVDTIIRPVDAPVGAVPDRSRGVRSSFNPGVSLKPAFNIQGGRIETSGSTTRSTGIYSTECPDFTLTDFTLKVGVSPSMRGVDLTRPNAEPSCLLDIEGVTIDVDTASATSDRTGLRLDNVSLDMRTSTVNMADSDVGSDGLVLKGADDSPASIRLVDVVINGALAPDATGVDIADHATGLIIDGLLVNGFRTVDASDAIGLNFDEGCSNCFVARVNVAMGDSFGTSTNTGVYIDSPGSSNGFTIFSSVFSPGTAANTFGVHTLGQSPIFASTRSVRLLGSIVRTGSGTGVHAAIYMEHDNGTNERALDVVGVAIVPEIDNAIGFLEECGNNNNDNGTRVGRAENIAFSDELGAFVFLDNASKTGANCNSNTLNSISTFNGTFPYSAANIVNDRSVFGDLKLLNDGVHVIDLTSVMRNEAPSLYIDYWLGIGADFVDFDNQIRNLPDDIGAIGF